MNELIQLEMTLDEARETDRLIKRHINTTRYLLLDMRDRKGWKALGYESFVEYGEKELNFASTHLYRLADAAEIALHIGFSPIGENQPRESQLRPLAQVPEDERKAIWDEATRKAEEEGAKLTAKRVEDAVAEWKQRQQESQAESNERRKTIRTLEEQIDLLTIRDRMMQGRLEKANEEIKYLATVVPEPEKIEVPPADYKQLKQTLAETERLLSMREEQIIAAETACLELKRDQDWRIQQNVVAKLAERQQEITTLEQQAAQLRQTITEYQAHIAKVHLPTLEMKQQIEVVEKFVLACSALAAALAMFEYAPDSSTRTVWQKGRSAALDAAEAMRLHLHRSPELAVVNG